MTVNLERFWTIVCAASLAGADRFYVGIDDPLSGSCSAGFNAPCAIVNIDRLVDAVAAALASAATTSARDQVLQNVNTGAFNASHFFWPDVIDATTGKFVASGTNDSWVGQLFVDVARELTLITQDDLFTRLHQAVNNGDGWYKFVGIDRVPGHHVAMKRLGYVKQVGNLLVTTAFTDMQLADYGTQQACKSAHDNLCTLSYVRKLVGRITGDLMSAGTAAPLQQVFAGVTYKEFNLPGGFYPFIYKFDGTCVAHGVNSANLGKTLQGIIAGNANLVAAGMDGAVLNNLFKNAAQNGGGFVSYMWANSADAPPQFKIALITGVKRFGESYYVGVGFNHVMAEAARGPNCEECQANYNYPCAWTNALALMGHVQSLLLITAGIVDSEHEAFRRITYEAEYKMPWNGNAAAGFYAFVYDLNGTCVAHGAKDALIGRTLEAIIAGNSALVEAGVNGATLHTQFSEQAISGGGWVRYGWLGADGKAFDKLSYIKLLNRGGRKYYVGVGLADKDWALDNYCSARYAAPCSESNAMSVMGTAMAKLVTATTNAQREAALQEIHNFRRPDGVQSPFAFATHVHSENTVLADGFEPSFLNMDADAWFGQVAGRSIASVFHAESDYDFEGKWIGPIKMATTSGVEREDHLLFTDLVHVSDFAADGLLDGAGDLYYVTTAVRDAKMPPMLKDTEVCKTIICEDPDDGNTWTAKDGPQCAEHDSALGDPGFCACKSGFTPEWTVASQGCSATACPAGTDCPLKKFQSTYNMKCMGKKEEGIKAWIIVVIVVSLAVPCIVVFLFFYCYHKRSEAKHKKMIKDMESQLQEFKNSIVGMKVIIQDFLPSRWGGSLATSEIAVLPKPDKPKYRSKWYWREDEGRLSSHNAHLIKDPYWVSYAGSVTAEIEDRYQAWRGGGEPAHFDTDLTDRIASTGTEMKAHGKDSGVKFRIDLQNMKQINHKSGFARDILREEVEISAPPGWMPDRAESPATEVLPVDKGSISIPAEIATDPLLEVYRGTIVQLSKQREDGWCFGTVVVASENSVPLRRLSESSKLGGGQSISSDTGWFPQSCSAMPSQEDFKKVQAMMGGDGAASSLQPPTHWDNLKDPLVAESFVLKDGPEKNAVIRAFMETLKPPIKVKQVQRVQNMSLWQSYAVKKQTMLAGHPGGSAADIERQWLFHGTNIDTVPKITQQGFNRSFCGKNATMYGKGVYFARDASYSASRTYSTPDKAGQQYMFLCRVAVGEYCKGIKDAPAPDVRVGNILYDTTVDNMRDPSIYVVYHDAQAYPEYLVTFSQ